MLVYTLKNTHLVIKVNSFGAELSSVKSSQNNIEYIWQADKQVWGRHAPHLFPIVGKLKEGEYVYGNKHYHLPQHGFARDMEFKCLENTVDKLVFELTNTEETFLNYPFLFSYKINYQLLEDSLKVEYVITNIGQNEMFFSVGAHPAFNCLLLPDDDFEDYRLIFHNKESITVNKLEEGLVSNQTQEIKLTQSELPVNKTLFANDALVCVNSQIDKISLISSKHQHGVSLYSPNWPYFGIWSKPGSKQFICLEPWYGIADFVDSNQNLTTKNGIIELKPHTSFTCNFSMQFF